MSREEHTQVLPLRSKYINLSRRTKTSWVVGSFALDPIHTSRVSPSRTKGPKENTPTISPCTVRQHVRSPSCLSLQPKCPKRILAEAFKTSRHETGLRAGACLALTAAERPLLAVQHCFHQKRRLPGTQQSRHLSKIKSLVRNSSFCGFTVSCQK